MDGGDESKTLHPPRTMTYILIVLICGINLAPFVLPQLDIWHAQGIFTQVCVLVLFSFSLSFPAKYKSPENKELGLLHLWVGLLTAFICMIAQMKGVYDITHFFPYFNFLCILILYKSIVQYLNIEDVEKLLKFIKYSLVATLIISVLQFLGCSQFFQLVAPNDMAHNNPVNGFIGNGTHLSGFLAMMIPVFLYFGKREDYLCLVLMGILLCFASTSTGEAAINGPVIAAVLVGLWILQVKRSLLWVYFGALIGITGLVYALLDHKDLIKFLSYSGRQHIYQAWWPYIKQFFVTGAGPGTMNALYKHTALPEVRHFHMEYVQFVLEIGVIGLALIVALVKKFFETVSKDKQMFSLKLIVVGFLISCCFNYPAHLWLSATYAAIAYSLFMVLKRGAQNLYVN